MTMSTRSVWLGGAMALALSVATPALAQPFAYVSGVRNATNNRGTQFLTVINVPTRARVTSIALGESCLCVGERAAVSPDGARLYVTNQALNGSNVKVIDTATNTVIGTIPTGQVPRAIDITPDGAVAYVAVQEAGVVSAISTASGAIVGSVPAGTRPLDVRVLPNGARVYSVSEDRLTAISTTTAASVGTIPITLSRAIDFTPDSTTGIVAADGRVHVVDTGANAIVGSITFNPTTEGNPIYVVIPHAVPPAPEAPTRLNIASIIGNTVTLRWTPPAAVRPPPDTCSRAG
jgi:YVTN family beta-propeller protein